MFLTSGASSGPARDYSKRLDSEVSLISYVLYENTLIFKRQSDKNEKFQLLKYPGVRDFCERRKTL